MRSQAVLVTGGAGYIGSHAALALLDAGWRVVVVDNLSTGFDWAVPQAAKLVVGDIADEQLMRHTLSDYDVFAIMHFAGSVVVPDSVVNPLEYYRNNTSKSLSLLKSAVAERVPHFIFSSTAAVYGTPETKLPVSEDAPTQPINPYGWSKLMTEQILADAASAHGFNYCVLRYFNVAGADPQGRAGQSTAGATHLIKVAVEAAVGKRDHIVVYGTDYETSDGTGVRDYIHVSDLARAHVDALERLIAIPDESLVMNCGYGRGYSVLEVLASIERLTNVEIQKVRGPRRAGDPAELVADNSRILRRLDWVPTRDSLDVIVSDALAWERRLPVG